MNIRNMAWDLYSNLGARAEAYGRIVCFICLVLGCGFLLGALGSTVFTESFIHQSIHVNGMVVELREVHDAENNSTNYAPVFTFKTTKGLSYTVHSDTSQNPAGFTVGEQVPVLYEPSQPTEARIDSFWQLWLTTFACGVVGMVFTMIACALRGYFRRLARRGLSLRVTEDAKNFDSQMDGMSHVNAGGSYSRDEMNER